MIFSNPFTFITRTTETNRRTQRRIKNGRRWRDTGKNRNKQDMKEADEERRMTRCSNITNIRRERERQAIRQTHHTHIDGHGTAHTETVRDGRRQ